MDIFAELKRLGALIRQLQGALGGKAYASGSVTLSWSASTTSGDGVVAHGLPTTPTSVQVTPRSIPFSGTITVKCRARDATNITINGEASSSSTGNVTVDWLAIG